MLSVQRQIMLSAKQAKWLDKRAEELECSVAEVIRRIIDEKREKNG